MDNHSDDRNNKEMDSAGRQPLITFKRIMLCLNCLILGYGIIGGPLIMRLYFVHGGTRTWLQSFLETAGFPVMIVPILITAFGRRRRRRQSSSSSSGESFFRLTPRLAITALGIGILTGMSDYLYSRGVKLIPVSTSSLVLSTHLAFTAIFCYFIVGQRFTPFSINAVVLLTVGAAVLATGSGGGAKEARTKGEYLAGFFMVMGSGAIFACVLPLVELTYRKAGVVVNYALVMEMQFMLALSATVFCFFGMLGSHDLQAIPKEASKSDLGKGMYYAVLLFSAISWQCFYLGALGVIHFGSSLLAAIITAVALPVSELLAVVFYNEKFQPEKAVSLALSLWGFISYFYGEVNQSKTKTSNEPTPDQLMESP